MKISYHIHSRSGFSILMALGTIGVLLIVVTGLASTYIRELRLSRSTYDEVLASASAEGVFEYGMLKVRNHRDGFADIVNQDDPDGKMFLLQTERSKGMKSSYAIRATSSDEIFSLEPNQHLIIPLFVADESVIVGAKESKYPKVNSNIKKTQDITVTGLGNLSWTIAAQKNNQSIGMTGTGDISPSTMGTIRHKDIQCYDMKGDKIDCLNSSIAEELVYFWDESMRTSSFLSDTSESYLMIYNSDINVKSIHLVADTPFSLPSMTIEATAQKNDSSQVFHFIEDKSRYYDAIKYGVYNN